MRRRRGGSVTAGDNCDNITVSRHRQHSYASDRDVAMSSAYRCSNSSDNNNCNNGDKNNDNNYCRHRRIAKAAAIVVAMAMVTGVKAFDDRDDDKWVRLCTLMSDGNSRTNASTPCGVVVGNNYDPDDGNNNNNNHNSHNDHNNNNHDNHNGDDDYPKVVVETTETPHRVENAFVGGDLSAAADDGNSAGTAVVDNDDYNDRQHDTSDDGEDDSVDVEDDSAVGVEHDEVYDGGDGNEEPLVYEDDVVLVETAVDKVDENVQESTAQLLEHQRREGVAKVMLSYLMDAKNQFYNKIRTYNVC